MYAAKKTLPYESNKEAMVSARVLDTVFHHKHGCRTTGFRVCD